MKLLAKTIYVEYDEVDMFFTVESKNSKDGTIFKKNVKTLEDVFNVLSKITKHKIVLRG